ncbi:MAG: phospholipase D family protein [Gammaproteobacteria bacterium]|nr:phospholipase D family protein [Gammaproteobacteria bacterium]
MDQLFCLSRRIPKAGVLASLALAWIFSTALAAQPLQEWVDASCPECAGLMAAKTGVYILEKGEEALIGRAWLTQHATQSIDIQYFIWSTDNIGTLAAEQLLLAAERGVVVRVLVDDLMIDAEDQTLLLLSAHPNVHIRIYNPNLSVGVSLWDRLFNSATDFRAVNQRMHDKTAIFDGIAGITGGRNMADEYFDFDHEYNFRDRDVLLLGPAVLNMSENFEEFWVSPLAVPVEQILGDSSRLPTDEEIRQRAQELHAYAEDPMNFEPEVRQAITDISRYFPKLLRAMSWEEVEFISDIPGKNSGESGLSGGGESTRRLIEAIAGARTSVLIQSPYLILPDGGIELLESLVERGVRIRISTNSLASTDNVPAFSGYYKQRSRLLEAGIELFEFKPDPGIQAQLLERYPRLAEERPIFALHAKSMVIDGKVIFIGTFNLDPRSANLNTEVGVLVESPELGRQLTDSIERDILPENSWQTTVDFNPDSEVSMGKRLHLMLDAILPMQPIL